MNPADFAEKGALIVPRPDRGTLSVTGPDRKSWLNGLLTCDVESLGAGRGVLGLFLTKQGKIVSDVLVVDTGEAVHLGVARDGAAALRDTLDRHLVMEDAEIADRSDELGWVFVYGARASELAAAFAREHALVGAEFDWAPAPAVALLAERSKLDATAQELAERGGADVRVASEEDWLRFRLQQGVGLFGVDFGPADNPHEAGLDRKAISWTKGCYLGQEVVCMQDLRGRVKRRLSLLEIDADFPPPVGSPVLPEAGAEPAGEITSAALLEPGRALALAKLKAPFFDPGARVVVAGNGARVLAAPGVVSSAR